MQPSSDAGTHAASPGRRPTDGGPGALRAALEARRREVFAQIAAYPAPIAGCDQQFNHLLARRDALTAALNGLDTPVDGAPDEAALEAVLAHLEPADRDALTPLRPR